MKFVFSIHDNNENIYQTNICEQQRTNRISPRFLDSISKRSNSGSRSVVDPSGRDTFIPTDESLPIVVNEDEGWLVGFACNLETARRQCPPTRTCTDPPWRRMGIVHIRTDSNSWCLCLNHQPSDSLSWNHPPLGWPQTRGWAISGLLSVSTPLDDFSLSLSLSICISLSRSLAINVRRFRIPSRTSSPLREILLIPWFDRRFEGTIRWILCDIVDIRCFWGEEEDVRSWWGRKGVYLK